MAGTFVGTWETTWVGVDNAPHPGYTVTVTESFRTAPPGKFLDGMYDLTNRQPGTMHGELSGNEWKGDWMNSPTDKGTFTLKLGDDDSFTGTYTFDVRKGEKWPWYSTRLKRRHVEAK
jgi:hypothetical protein